MIDINLIRENKEAVKENIRKKFQDQKVPLVDEIYELDIEYRKLKTKADTLRSKRNNLSNEIGLFMKEGKTDKAQENKDEVNLINKELENLEKEENHINEKINILMMKIPNIMNAVVPIGKNDEENVELEKIGEQTIYNYEIPYHTEILERLNGIDLDSARKISGNGFYFLTGDIALLHSAILSYARDFMIEKGFTYVIPPFMIHKEVVENVMSFEEMDNMMYKIEGEDLYLIGTSEHSMIGRFKDTILSEESLPLKLTSYSPCFRKEKGAHGIEERGIYRIHQFEKQEMIVVCNPNDSEKYFENMWKYTVELFRNMNIPVRTIECCSGDLADLKTRSIDIEAWSPRQKKYFEVGSCSNLGEAQSRRLKIRVSSSQGKYYPHTLNNTVVAPPRMLIAFIENNYNEDGTINIPKSLEKYMNKSKIVIK